MADYNANILCCVFPCNQPNHIVEGQLLEVYGEYKYTVKVKNIRTQENFAVITFGVSS